MLPKVFDRYWTLDELVERARITHAALFALPDGIIVLAHGNIVWHFRFHSLSGKYIRI